MTYQPNKPQANDFLSDSQLDLLNNFSVNDTTLNVDHYPPSNNTVNRGQHRQVHLVNLGGLPALSGADGLFYAALINSKSWPVWFNSTGTGYAIMRDDPVGSPTGRAWIPGNILLQWGVIVGAPNIANGQVVTFNNPFPTNVFTAVITGATGSTDDKTINITNGSLSTSGFTVITSGTSSFNRVYYIAIGN